MSPLPNLPSNARGVVTAVDDYRADVFVDGETVALIGHGLERGLEVAADRIVDATGKLLLPGGIDPHTHMELPFGGTESSDTFETGTRAAAFGGTTSIVDFAVQTRGASTIEGLDAWHAKADGNAAINYAFHMIVTDLPDERVPELRRLADEGVTSYKLFIAYPGALLVDDATIDVNRFVELTSTAAARIFGMFPRKGTIAVGSDADIVIFDPEREVTISRGDPHTHHMNVDYSAYEGFRVRGYPETVLSRGRVVVDKGEYVGRPGDGGFIRRGPYGGAYAAVAAANRGTPLF